MSFLRETSGPCSYRDVSADLFRCFDFGFGLEEEIVSSSCYMRNSISDMLGILFPSGEDDRVGSPL